MKNDREIKSEVSALRERVKNLSGFWIGEGAASIYALEWVLGKHEAPPAQQLGKSGGGYERIAANLTKTRQGSPHRRPQVEAEKATTVILPFS